MTTLIGYASRWQRSSCWGVEAALGASSLRWVRRACAHGGEPALGASSLPPRRRACAQRIEPAAT
ncbi:hypothetical protein, partial [Mycobacterium asiaticum]|uniref:hypothetical protein n=1 Tax=Mycobacterium asiaticum TaxID=1790 RepID=UPI001C12A837